MCISAVPGILEAAAVAVPESGGGPDQLVMFVVPSGSDPPDTAALRQRCQRAIRDGINPLFKLQRARLFALAFAGSGGFLYSKFFYNCLTGVGLACSSMAAQPWHAYLN